jgi:hypothetical protein
MPLLSTIRVIHTTSNVDDAGTDADFQLQVERNGGDVLREFPDLPHDERERGRTDHYEFDVSGEGVNSDDPSFAITMRMISSEDGWLPQSIFVSGDTFDGNTVLLGSHPQWDRGWFDKGDDPAGPVEHRITNN